MGFEDVMAAVSELMVATDALAAIGAHLSLQAQGQPAGDPATVDALRRVCSAAGMGDIDGLEPGQQMMLLGIVRLCFGQADDLLRQPARPPGWTFTDPGVLEGIGRGSMMVPRMMAAAPDLENVTSLLDVGVGVGWLAVAAAAEWPAAQITGIDIWEPALDRARANVRSAGLEDRIVLRQQDVLDLEEVDAYDCAWVPTFFIVPDGMKTAVANVVRALQPAGRVVLGRFADSANPLAAATSAVRTIRGGGGVLSADECVTLLRDAGCDPVSVFRPKHPMPIELVIGHKC